jgi:peptidoglycan-N-acetylglucosamine deacetylase
VESWTTRPVLKNYIPSKLPISDKDYMIWSVREVLNLFRKYDSVGTFFVVGKNVDAAPEVLDMIVNEGHEVGVHSYSHTNLRETNPEAFEKETILSRDMIWRRTGNKPRGFRAPEFSLYKDTAWALDVLERCGFSYDSSIVPGFRPSRQLKAYFQMTQRAPIIPYRPSHTNPSAITTRNDERLVEFPALVRDLGLVKIPVGGGFYGRFFGSNFVLSSIRKVARASMCPMFYIHNWEVTGFPRIPLPPLVTQFAYLRVPNTELLSYVLRNVESITADDALERFGPI